MFVQGLADGFQIPVALRDGVLLADCYRGRLDGRLRGVRGGAADGQIAIT
jgi:hypothetical protein